MSSLHTMITHLSLCLGGGDEREIEAHVSYWFTKPWPQSHDDPGSDALIEICSIQLHSGDEFHVLPPFFTDVFAGDSELIAACLADRAEEHAAAAEYAAEARRDDRMMEQF